MAKITRSLDDIEKLVKKAHQSPKEQLKEVRERLKLLNIKKGFNNLEYYNKNGTTAERPDQEEYKTLKEAEKILIEEIETENDKKEINQIKLNDRLEKQIKKEIKELLYNNILKVFKEYPEEQALLVYRTLHYKEAIEEETQKITNVYGLEFNDYILTIYIKTLDQVYQLFKYRIKEEEKKKKIIDKLEDEERKRKTRKTVAKSAVIIGLLKYANRKKRYK